MKSRKTVFASLVTLRGDRLIVQVVLGMLPVPNLKRPPSRAKKLWTEVVREYVRTLGIDRHFGRDVKFRLFNSDGWTDSIRALAEDRKGWSQMSIRTTHPCEDKDTRVRPQHPPAV
ncbi:hypothetical protein RB195_014655 [Necator americanus]|uniref:Uncharacterized protein n=1 Tax=Necator americanus TaxID=51031 RepID=A0ABR1E0Z4_NECAM